MNLRILLVSLGLMALAAAPSAAQDDESVALAEASTVRVAVIISNYQGRFLHSTGSGFVVAPNIVVTNAHVAAPARQYPGMITLAVIPPDSPGLIEAQIVRFSESQDLALLRFGGASPEPLALSALMPRTGDDVVALGYPDIDDLDRPAVELVRPTAPSRSGGAVAALRDRAPTGDPIPTINHDAAISSGSSGGPLLDRCGRVIGVNTWHARGARTLEGRAVATRVEQLITFLQSAGIQPTITDAPCRTAVERAEEERDAAVAALERQNQEIADRLAEADRLTRVTFTAVIGVGILFLAALIALAVVLFNVRRRPAAPAPPDPLADAMPAHESATPLPPLGDAPRQRSRGFWPILLVVGGAGAAAALVVPLAIRLLESREQIGADRVAASFAGEQACTFDPRASETLGADTSFAIDAEGCVNGRTLYAEAEDGRALQRFMLSEGAGRLQVMTLAPSTGEFSMRMYNLSRTTLEAASAAARATPAPDGCGAGAREQVLARNQALARFAAGAPAENIVWNCRKQ